VGHRHPPGNTRSRNPEPPSIHKPPGNPPGLRPTPLKRSRSGSPLPVIPPAKVGYPGQKRPDRLLLDPTALEGSTARRDLGRSSLGERQNAWQPIWKSLHL